jgi:choline dehydrogenase-like flavoprotein
MIVSARDGLPSGFADADVTIVGAGAVGIAMGLALSRAGRRVLILEAGGRSPPGDYRALNQGRAVGRAHRGIGEGRMRAVGGTTRLWGGQLVPFGPLDFAGIAEAGLVGWPIGYDDVAPWFDRAFDLLSVDAAARDEAAVRARFLADAPDLGDELSLGLNIWLREPDFTRLFGRELATSERLCILADAEVERFALDEAGTVTSVQVGSATMPVRQLVLANGTIEIARLLLHMAARQPAGVLGRLPMIGAGYIDHLHGLAGEIRQVDTARLSAIFDNIYVDRRKYGVKIRMSDALRRGAGISNCAGTINAKIGAREMLRDGVALARRVFAGDAASAGALMRETWAMARLMAPLAWRYLVRRRAGGMLSNGVYLGLELEQVRSARSRIILDPERSADEAAVLLQWELDGREIEAAAVFCETVAARFGALGLGTVEIDPRILARDPAFFDDCHDANHQMGGAAMGSGAHDGVVDRDCRVFGTSNLHVAGAAVFPSGSFANPTLTAIALGLRLADRLVRC